MSRLRVEGAPVSRLTPSSNVILSLELFLCHQRDGSNGIPKLYSWSHRIRPIGLEGSCMLVLGVLSSGWGLLSQVTIPQGQPTGAWVDGAGWSRRSRCREVPERQRSVWTASDGQRKWKCDLQSYAGFQDTVKKEGEKQLSWCYTNLHVMALGSEIASDVDV